MSRGPFFGITFAEGERVGEYVTTLAESAHKRAVAQMIYSRDADGREECTGYVVRAFRHVQRDGFHEDVEAGTYRVADMDEARAIGRAWTGRLAKGR